MTEERAHDEGHFYDFMVSATITAIALVAFAQAYRLPDGAYEPLGPGFLPLLISGLIALLAGGASIVSLRRGALSARLRWSRANLNQLGRQTVFGVAVIAYVLALQSGVLPFWIITTVLVFGLSLLLGGMKARVAAGGLAFALVLGIGLQLIFTRLFVIDLPGL